VIAPHARTMASIPAIGSAAPNFTLPSTAGGDVTLSALRGRNVLIAFFPLAFTSVCTREMCEFSEDYAQYGSASTEVLPISVDSIPALREFKNKERLGVDLLSDFKRDVSRRYGVLLESFFSARAYFLVDRDGIIRWSFVEETPGTKRGTADLLEQIRRL
jgi:glutaredoxin-dependent peroxiredoxin